MKPIDIKGRLFGRLKVIRFSHINNTAAYWFCICKCGNKRQVKGSSLRRGTTKSCGCLAKELSSVRFRKYTTSDEYRGSGNPAFKHGGTGTKLFKIYQGIRGRCHVKSAGNYAQYGRIGIKMEWRDFISFKRDMEKKYFTHVKEYGEENTFIDRINSLGNYSKNNCRWATLQVQARNKKSSRWLTYKGKTMVIKDWADKLGFNVSTLYHRANKCWTTKQILETQSRRIKWHSL